MTVAGSEMLLTSKELVVSYGEGERATTVLNGVSLSVSAGDFLCVVGPSGCGKTTLLRCLAGLQAPTSGSVVFEGQSVSGPPKGLAVVFQDYSRSLLPWLKIAANIELPLRRLPVEKRREKTEAALEAVGLKGKGELYPWQLSGGMQQRAAIARGIAYQPDVLLMDEPFAAVDAQTRIDLEDLVKKISREFNTTVLFVTHDIDEAVYLGNRVAVLSSTPTIVLEEVAIDLPEDRDQVATKGSLEFIRYRNDIFSLIQQAKRGPSS